MPIFNNPIYWRWLLVGSFILTLSLGAMLLVWPQYQTVQSSAVVQYQTEQAAVQQRKNYLQDLQLMQKNYDQLDKRIVQTVQSVAPTNYDSALAFAEIETLLQKSHFSVQSINVVGAAAATTATTTTSASAANAATNFNTIQVTVNLGSHSLNYQEYKTFLLNLENYQHLVDLASLTYSPGSDSLALVFKMYSLKAQ